MTTFRDPDLCPRCRARGRVVESRRTIHGYRRRRHACPTCTTPEGDPLRWSSWQTMIHPKRLRAVERAETPHP